MAKESAATQLARVGAILELALYGNHDARNPRPVIDMAGEAHDRIRRLHRVTDHLLSALADVGPRTEVSS